MGHDLDDDELRATRRMFERLLKRKNDIKDVIKRIEEGEANDKEGTDNIIKGTERESSQD